MPDHHASNRTTSDSFARIFGTPASHVARAHGRVNLIGEHTDYNDGFVLPLAIPQATSVAIGRRNDARVRAFSRELDREMMTYRLGEETTTGDWVDYLRGITRELSLKTGFDLYV